MPNYTGYIQKDPTKRPHIYEWTSQYQTSSGFYAEAGTGYFIYRRSKDIDITFPSNPFDGDVIAIVDITKERDFESASNVLVKIAHPGTKVFYYGKSYAPEEPVQLSYLAYYQQYFLYSAHNNTWIGSYIYIDATIAKQELVSTYGLVYYGTSISNAADQIKTTNVDNSFDLDTGVHVRVVFVEENSANNPTLNVNATGNIPIKITQYETAGPKCWKAGQAVDFVFDGFAWLMVDTNIGGGGSSIGGSGGSSLTANQVNYLIEQYLISNNITGVSNHKIKEYIREYLEQNGAQAGISESECVQIIQNYLDTHNIQGTVDEATVNRLIAQYIQNNNIGSGGGGSGSGGGLTTNQINQLIENYYNTHAGSGKGITYCISPTNANIPAKIATIQDGSNTSFQLKTGTSVRVKFSSSNTIDNPTLNVNNTGSKNIIVFGSTQAKSNQWKDGEVIDFVYDGTSWLLVDGSRKYDLDNFAETLSNSGTIGNLINTAVNNALQGEIETMIDNKTANTIAALNAQVDAKIEEMQGNVASSIQTLQDDVASSIEAFRAEVGSTRTQLERSISDAIVELQGQIADEIADIGTVIDQKISTTFDQAIDEKIQANFTNVVQGQINTATSALEASIAQLRSDLTGNVDQQIENMTSVINSKIAQFESDFAEETRQLRASIQTSIAETFAATINQRIEEAFESTIDEKILAAFEGAEGTLNTAIASYQQSINQQFTEIRSSVSDDIRIMREYMEDQLDSFAEQIDTTINVTFDSKIEEKINTGFETRVRQIVQAEFLTSINSLVSDKVDELDAKIKNDIKEAVDNFNDKVDSFIATIDNKIAAHYNAHISQDIEAVRVQLRNEIQNAVKNLENTIDTKLENKFNSSIDALMEEKFSAMIDEKIQEGFDESVQNKVNAAKTEIMNSIDARIDAKIRTAIDGEITTLINTKLEDYIAPAIGALY